MERRADAGGDPHAVLVDGIWIADDANQFVADERRVLGARQVDQQHELVAAIARQEVRATDGVAQTRGDELQQHVADEMAVLVVDVLESIEVDEEQRGNATRRRDPLRVDLELFDEAAAVRQPSEEVVRDIGDGVQHPDRLAAGGVAQRGGGDGQLDLRVVAAAPLGDSISRARAACEAVRVGRRQDRHA